MSVRYCIDFVIGDVPEIGWFQHIFFCDCYCLVSWTICVLDLRLSRNEALIDAGIC